MPFYAVNHLGGHLAADVYDHGPLPECVGLLVSGGHTHLLHVRSLGEPIVELGSTVDDAAGEAYDKVARLLGLGYPGGKALDDLARTGNRDAIAFPARHDRTARRAVRVQLLRAQDRGRPLRREAIPTTYAADVAAGFQEAVADVLTAKAVRAATELKVSTLLIAGGVAANSRLRELAEERCAAAGFDAANPAAAAVHRQRRDDRLVRRAPDRRRSLAVAAGRGQRPGSARRRRPGAHEVGHWADAILTGAAGQPYSEYATGHP